MPKWILRIYILFVVVTLIPAGLVYRARWSRPEAARIHLIPDMDTQGKYKGQSANPLFADGRAMRPPVAETVARGELYDDDHYHRGRKGEDWATDFPPQVTVDEPFVQRGRDRYDIYCAPCHGLNGDGDGMVSERATNIPGVGGTAWVRPSSYFIEPAVSRSVGHLFNTITNGQRNMSAYGSQVPVRDRWAIVAWIKTLQAAKVNPPGAPPVPPAGNPDKPK